jgi:hypothetical protein
MTNYMPAMQQTAVHNPNVIPATLSYPGMPGRKRPRSPYNSRETGQYGVRQVLPETYTDTYSPNGNFFEGHHDGSLPYAQYPGYEQGYVGQSGVYTLPQSYGKGSYPVLTGEVSTETKEATEYDISWIDGKGQGQQGAGSEITKRRKLSSDNSPEQIVPGTTESKTPEHQIPMLQAQSQAFNSCAADAVYTNSYYPATSFAHSTYYNSMPEPQITYT